MLGSNASRSWCQCCAHSVIKRDRTGVLLGQDKQQRDHERLSECPLAPKGQSLEARVSIDTERKIHTNIPKRRPFRFQQLKSELLCRLIVFVVASVLR